MSQYKKKFLYQIITEVKSGFASGDNLEEGLFQIRMNNITKSCLLDLSTRRRVGLPKKVNDFLLRSGDVLFNATNSPEMVGKVALFHDAGEPASFSNHFIRLRFKDEIFSGYVYHFLASEFRSGTFSSICKQWVNQATVSKESLLSLEIPLPPLAEQRRIAEILDRAEALRAKRREAIALLDELGQALFLEMFGDPAFNPFDFPTIALGNVAKKFSDGPFGSNLKSEHYTENGVQVIRLQNVGIGKFLNKDRAYISETHARSLSKHYCLPGDIIVGTLGDPNLRACIIPDSIKISINKADCVQVRVDESKANVDFLCALINHPSTEKLAQDLVLGQTRSRISMGRLKGLRVPIPPILLQQKFSTELRRLNLLKLVYTEASNNLDELFASLQHRAFRGEL